jgi:hypothetical protein
MLVLECDPVEFRFETALKTSALEV